MNFTVENLEFYLLVLVRMSSFVMTAPFLSYASLPVKVKLAISFVLTLVVIQVIPIIQLDYVGVIGYSTLIVKEACVGAAIGFMANVCLYIVNFAGQLMDMEIGLSMVNLFDPQTHIQGTVSGAFYTYMVMLIMIVSNMHYYLIRAIVDSFRYFNVGEAVFSRSITDVMTDFMPNYMIIGFRIILPVFGCMLLINVVLGVLAKAAPQMNMFVIGLQLKVLIGILILAIMVEMIPTISDFIFGQMKEVISAMMKAFTPN